MHEFLIVNQFGRVILSASSKDAVIRLSRTSSFAGTPSQRVFGTIVPIDTTEYDAYHGVGAFTKD